ncbi:benzoate/H(+) symporter BenE family transporter, partial [Erwinia amylovora]|uniref:benzoate/H(+) symporter BenE family transporter n=1 Tax=Erwinia amylovora TaxID=552 RepID=UPI0020C05113
PQRRNCAAAAAGVFYLQAGRFGGAIVELFNALPLGLIHTNAGLALLGTLSASLQRAQGDEKQRDAAALAFLITASGVTLLGVASAFW